MSDEPFRNPAESPTSAALARLGAIPVHPIRRMCAAVARYRTTASAPARQSDVDTAERTGFTCIGNAAEGLLPVYRKRVYVDASRTTQAQLSSQGYFFVTYFESGMCIITWGHAPLTPSSDVLLSRAGGNGFEPDYEGHLAEVRKRADSAIVVADLQTAVALGDFYYRGVVSLGLATLTITVVLMPLVIVLGIIGLLLSRR